MGDINNHDDGSVSIHPDIAEPSGQELGVAEEPDYTVELELANRTVLVDLVEGEPMALNTPDGQVFAQLSVTEYTDG